MQIQKQNSVLGYSMERLEKGEKENWVLVSETLLMDKSQKLEQKVYTEIFFNQDFVLQSFMVSMEKGKKKSWYKGTTQGNELFLENSRRVKKTVALPSGAIPENLLLLRFLTTDKSSAVYEVFEITTGKSQTWEIALLQKKQLSMKLEETPSISFSPISEEEEEETKDSLKKKKELVPEEVGVLVIGTGPREEEKDKAKKEKQYRIVYQVAITGKAVPPSGVVVEKKEGDLLCTWIPRYQYANMYRMLLPFQSSYDREERLKQLKQAVELLLEEDGDTRLNAVIKIEQIGFWQGVPALIEMLNDEDERVKARAHSALKKITRKRFQADVKLWRMWWLAREKMQEPASKAKKDVQESEKKESQESEVEETQESETFESDITDIKEEKTEKD